jgi:hypothetical protein
LPAPCIWHICSLCLCSVFCRYTYHTGTGPVDTPPLPLPPALCSMLFVYRSGPKSRRSKSENREPTYHRILNVLDFCYCYFWGRGGWALGETVRPDGGVGSPLAQILVQ